MRSARLAAIALAILCRVASAAETVRVAGPLADGEDAAAKAMELRLAFARELAGAGHQVVDDAGGGSVDRALTRIEGRARVEKNRVIVVLWRASTGEACAESASFGRYRESEPEDILRTLAALDFELARGRREFLSASGESPARALELLTEAIRADPAWVWPRFRVARALRLLGRPEEAAGAIEAVLAIDPGFARAVNERGLVAYQAGDLDGATASFVEAIRIDQCYAEAHNNLASVLWERVELESATREAAAAVALEPDYFHAWANLGNCHYLERRHAEAVRCFERAIELSDGFLQARAMLGKTFYEMEEYDQSERTFRELLARRADDLEAHFHLALIAWRDEGRLVEALEHLQAYRGAGGDDRRVPEWIDQLRRRTGSSR